MRTTMRIVITMMNAIENALEEIANSFPRDGAYTQDMVELRKRMRLSRQAASALLDRMIDEG